MLNYMGKIGFLVGPKDRIRINRLRIIRVPLYNYVEYDKLFHESTFFNLLLIVSLNRNKFDNNHIRREKT